MKIKRWLVPCAFDAEVDERGLLATAGRILDKSYLNEGTVLFEGEDGKIYTGSFEFEIFEANPAYVKEALESYAEDQEETRKYYAEEETP